MKEFVFEIDTNGDILCLNTDDIPLHELGQQEFLRASHVEPDNATGTWYVQSAATGEILAYDFKTRTEALDWEKEYYSPDGPGWSENTL